MDLSTYNNLKVYITLTNGFYFIGKVLEANESDITILDKTKQRVTLSKDVISTIREIT